MLLLPFLCNFELHLDPSSGVAASRLLTPFPFLAELLPRSWTGMSPPSGGCISRTSRIALPCAAIPFPFPLFVSMLPMHLLVPSSPCPSQHGDGEVLPTGHHPFSLHSPSHAEDASLRLSYSQPLSLLLDGHRPTLVPSVLPSPQRPPSHPSPPLRALFLPPRILPGVKRELSGSHRGAIFASISIRNARASRACFARVRTFCDVAAACERHLGAPWKSTA